MIMLSKWVYEKNIVNIKLDMDIDVSLAELCHMTGQ